MASLPPGNAESPAREMLDETNGTLLPRKARAAHYFIGLNPPFGRSNTWFHPRRAQPAGFHTWRAASARNVWEPAVKLHRKPQGPSVGCKPLLDPG